MIQCKLKEISGNYDITIKYYLKDVLSDISKLIGKEKRNVLIVDRNVYDIYSEFIHVFVEESRCEILVIDIKEENKNYETITLIYDFLIEKNIHRDSTLVAMGGGVLGDIVGFAASTYMRGVKYINVPTTLISQTDSSVGGKVGYNYGKIKNILGSFYNPTAVFIPLETLNSLDNRNYINGICEVIKYSLIYSKDFFAFLEKNIQSIINRDKETLLYIIQKCLEIKIHIVNEDFKDENKRNVLNFGHTAGHALEIISNFNIMHGEAVALGMLIAVKLSEYKLSLSKDIYNRLLKMYFTLGIDYNYNINNIEEFISIMKRDKKNDEEIRFVLLEDFGKCKIKTKVTEVDLLKAINEGIGEI